MEKYMLFLFVLMSCCLASIYGRTQQATTITQDPKWTPSRGYWVIESSKTNPESSKVFFYSDDHELVYSEQVEGRVLNCKKRKVLLQLKQALETSLAARDEDRNLQHNSLMVLSRLKNR